MEAQFYIQKSLRERLDELKIKNASFSLRAFARLLEISPATLSEFLNGKRVLSNKMLKKIALKLAFTPEELSMFEEKLSPSSSNLDPLPVDSSIKKKVQIQNDQYFLIADWHYYAILCLIETENFKKDYNWIANKLSTTEKKVKECFERLLRLGYLTYDQDGNITYHDVELSSTEDIPNTSLKRRHNENLEAASNSLQLDDVSVRDFSFMTMAMDPAHLPQVKKMIRDFQDKLAAYLDSCEKKTDVYEICMQVFPRTKVTKENENETLH